MGIEMRPDRKVPIPVGALGIPDRLWVSPTTGYALACRGTFGRYPRISGRRPEFHVYLKS
jgi:hypothetical protein